MACTSAPSALPSTTDGGAQPLPSPPVKLPQAVGPGGVPHTVYDETEPHVYLGPGGTETTLANAQGLCLKAYFWAAEKPVATLIMCHGHGAHLQFELLKSTVVGQAQSYAGSWAEHLNNAGISVCGIDNQGCGRSEGLAGLRFYVDTFEDYVNDVLQLAEAVVVGNNNNTIDIPEGFSGLPLFISGISLGGCIAFMAALARPEIFAAALLLAPMLSLEKVARKGLNAYLKPVASVLSRLVPTAAIVATDKNVLNPAIQALWDADPLCAHGKTRVRNASEYLRATEIALASLQDFNLPLYVAHSEFDTMTDCDGSKALYLKAKTEDKTLRLVNHMWHVLVKEQGNEALCDELCEWIRKRAVSE